MKSILDFYYKYQKQMEREFAPLDVESPTIKKGKNFQREFLPILYFGIANTKLPSRLMMKMIISIHN